MFVAALISGAHKTERWLTTPHGRRAMRKGTPPIYIINLRRSVDRRRHIEKQFSESTFRPCFCRAFDGHNKAFPFFVFRSLSGRWWHDADNFKPGGFACFLSHAATWAKVAYGSSPYAFVFEDDVTLNLGGLEDCLLGIENAQQPFDVIFVSESMSHWISGVEEKAVIPIPLYDRVLDGTYADRIPPPGAYGYAVSKRGARKLLHICNSRGINMGVDYAMLLGLLTRPQLTELAQRHRLPPSIRDQIHNELTLFADEEPIDLDVFLYARAPVAKHPETFPSSISHRRFLANEHFSGLKLRHVRWGLLKCLLLYWRIRRH